MFFCFALSRRRRGFLGEDRGVRTLSWRPLKFRKGDTPSFWSRMRKRYGDSAFADRGEGSYIASGCRDGEARSDAGKGCSEKVCFVVWDVVR